MGDRAHQAAAEVGVGDEGAIVGGPGGGQLLEQLLQGLGEAADRATWLEPEPSCPRRSGRAAGA